MGALGRPYTRGEIIGMIEVKRNDQIKHGDAARQRSAYDAARCYKQVERTLNDLLETIRAEG